MDGDSLKDKKEEKGKLRSTETKRERMSSDDRG
jgi:hypothetical protein